ncbi:MAG TPA: hypothetical protein VHA14_12980 [Bryobacteraceae bacterium]|nr:hypothetical protein [Bryobacteraceae bacterium]
MPRPTPDLPSGFLTQLSAASGIRCFTLAFIIGNSDGSCQATWGGRTPLAGETALRIAIDELPAQGGDILISFGDEAGNEVALTRR